MSEQTINPLPSAGSDFLEVLLAFLQNEDAERFNLQFRGFVVLGGLHGTVAGLTATPSALTAFPGGYYITETGAITYPDATTTWVIADKDTTGNLTGYTRVAGTHYLIASGVSAPALPADTIRLMKVTTAAGAITAVVDERQMSPLVNDADTPFVRLIGADADLRIAEDSAQLVISENTATEDEPTWNDVFRMTFGSALSTFVFLATVARTYTWRDMDGTVAFLSDIAPPTVWVTGDYKWNATNTPQTDWLLCDGSAVSRTTYATLFGVIGTTFGPGNGSTTFNLPDARGRFFMHVSASHAAGDTGGAETHTLTTAELPPHTHPANEPGGSFVLSTGAGTITFPNAGADIDVDGNTSTGSTGSNQAHSILNPFITGGYLFIRT